MAVCRERAIPDVDITELRRGLIIMEIPTNCVMNIYPPSIRSYRFTDLCKVQRYPRCKV